MNIFRRTFVMILAAVMTILLLPLDTAHAESWQIGNTDLNIQNGGVMLSDGGNLYFNHGGLFVKRGERVYALSADDGKNLNLWNGYLYYTVGETVKKMPESGGTATDIHSASDIIKQMYVINGAIKYLAGGKVYELSDGASSAVMTTDLTDVMRLIPTQYGDLFLTGEVFDYTVWAGGKPVLSGVRSCYTDGDQLAVQIGNQNYMTELSALFGSFNADSDLQDFNLHGTAGLCSLLAPDDDNTISEYNDNYDLVCDYDALLKEAGLVSESAVKARTMTAEAALQTLTPPISEGQRNIVKRARQLNEIKWTPLENRTQWGSYGVFYAENTYTGIPYGQPVNSNGYIGYGVSLETFASSVLDNSSKFYTAYSTYNKIAPVYSTDCSGYVSYAWGLESRKTTYSLPYVAEKVGDQSLYSLQVGDCLNETRSHVVLISSITYDTEGNIIGLEVMEQTPVITRLTRYGAGQSRSLASFQSYYLERGYAIYRYTGRDSVTYTPSEAVQLDNETAAREKAPKSHTKPFVGGKTVELTSDTPGAAIYYTTDGSAPTANSTAYSGAITLYNTTKLRAIAVSANCSGSTILEYTVKVPQLEAPTAAVTSGVSEGNRVSSGTQISLSSIRKATIYYTTDGSEPTTASKVYSSPITLSSDTTIKAMARAEGYSQSGTMTATYKIAPVYSITAKAGANGSISPSGTTGVIQSGSKAYSITPNSGYAVSDVIVDGVSVGAVKSYTFSNVTSNHSISASFRADAKLPFDDVTAGTWYYDAVCFAYSNNLFNGMSPSRFEPDTEMQRGMFVTVLGRFAGLSNSLSGTIGLVTATGVNIRQGPSTDTPVVGFVSNRYTALNVLGKSGNWYKVRYGTVTGYIRNDLMRAYEHNYTDLMENGYYSVYAQWAYLAGITEGVADSRFRAEECITREDMCRIMYNYAKVYGKTLPVVEGKTTFSDDAQIASNHKTAVYALQQANIIEGIGNNTFSPKGTASRAHVAQIYKNFVEALS
ncbi:MAG: SH3 domain-containing protein [Clostridiales bacterium]|nr:SH3 domain-containing protein [Clostridiales bacterium]